MLCGKRLVACFVLFVRVSIYMCVFVSDVLCDVCMACVVRACVFVRVVVKYVCVVFATSCVMLYGLVFVCALVFVLFCVCVFVCDLVCDAVSCVVVCVVVMFVCSLFKRVCDVCL